MERIAGCDFAECQQKCCNERCLIDDHEIEIFHQFAPPPTTTSHNRRNSFRRPAPGWTPGSSGNNYKNSSSASRGGGVAPGGAPAVPTTTTRSTRNPFWNNSHVTETETTSSMTNLNQVLTNFNGVLGDTSNKNGGDPHSITSGGQQSKLWGSSSSSSLAKNSFVSQIVGVGGAGGGTNSVSGVSSSSFLFGADASGGQGSATFPHQHGGGSTMDTTAGAASNNHATNNITTTPSSRVSLGKLIDSYYNSQNQQTPLASGRGWNRWGSSSQGIGGGGNAYFSLNDSAPSTGRAAATNNINPPSCSNKWSARSQPTSTQPTSAQQGAVLTGGVSEGFVNSARRFLTGEM